MMRAIAMAVLLAVSLVSCKTTEEVTSLGEAELDAIRKSYESLRGPDRVIEELKSRGNPTFVAEDGTRIWADARDENVFEGGEVIVRRTLSNGDEFFASCGKAEIGADGIVLSHWPITWGVEPASERIRYRHSARNATTHLVLGSDGSRTWNGPNDLVWIQDTISPVIIDRN